MTAAAAGVWFLALAAARLYAQTPDTTFILGTTDVRRSPSPFVGNGRVGVVIPPLGIGAAPSFMAGLYEEAPGDIPRIVAVPAWNATTLTSGETSLDTSAAAGSIEHYRQTVDMRTATARTTYDWVHGGERTSVSVETFVSRAAPEVAVTRLAVTPRSRGSLRVRFAIAAWPPPHRLPLATAERTRPDWDVWYPGRTIARARSATRESRGARLAMTSTPEGSRTVLEQVSSVRWGADLINPSVTTHAAGDTAMVEITFEARPGRTQTFNQITSMATGADAPGPRGRASTTLDGARALGVPRVVKRNADAWASRWRTDVLIEGDAGLQRVVRSMLFYLLCSADAGTALGIPPMGLSSAGYYGHVFWDSDTWMFPSLLLTHPDVAHSLVAFRARTLGAARENAKANGFAGAMYPWEADGRGVETTPHFAVQNAKSEIHVTGDVAQAQWQYYLATGDSAWLANEGYPVIRATAEFWVSRSTRDSIDGSYHIGNVVSVAEGLIGVTDDAYTNAVARKNLEIAAAASRLLGETADPQWDRIAARLHLPYDSASGFYRTYEGAPDSTLGDVTPLLAYPLAVPMSVRAKRTHIEQAVRKLLTRGGGAMMGSTLLSVGAAELGDRALVDSLLPRSYQDHVKGPFLMLSETPTNDAVDFVTGAGGFLQQVIYGYSGLRLGAKGLDSTFAPLLPSKIRRLTLRNIHVRGKTYDVVVDSTGRRVLPRKDRAH
jgi:trehalose/maltose hydrolase-like predicted phosphorylase